MSAAEKLKALDGAMSNTPWRFGWDLEAWDYPQTEEDAQAVVAIRNALPQIVAVVEAAERFGDEDETAMAWANIKRDIRAALAALDEALGDVT